MAGFGSAPKPEGQRRTRVTPMGGSIRRISGAGRASEVPKWPLTGQTAREKVLWARLWLTPQSAVWDEAENRLHAQKSILRWCFGQI